MKLLDSMLRVLILTQGIGMKWLREELAALQMRIPLTDGCLGELLRRADEAARAAAGPDRRYSQQLRSELGELAKFIQRWTGSDEPIAGDEESLQPLVRIARKYALPRRWKVSEPVVVEYRRTRPSYWNWSADVDSHAAVPQP